VSVDRKIDQVCPHIVYEEALFVAADRMTVRPLRPISSAGSVGVFLNHEIQVPPDGVGLPASSQGSTEGLITIRTGVNDTFRLSINQQPEQVVTLPPLYGVSMKQLAALLNLNLNNEIVFSVIDRKVAFKTTRTGASESVFIPDTSTLATALGFQTNREYRGMDNLPGWTLIGDPNTLSDRPTRLIVFDEPLRSGSDFVEINYATVQQECRRCGGTGIENDWRYNRAGEVILTRDEDLLIQELQKNFYTILGSNPFHTWYGTQLVELVGKKLSSGSFLQNLVTGDIYTAFTRWQSIKSQQEQKVGQLVTDKEFPFRLLSVSLEQSTQDPTVVFVNMTVMNRSNEPIQISRGLRLPYPLDLLGSTAQDSQRRSGILTG